jgi:hypothetical protein
VSTGAHGCRTISKFHRKDLVRVTSATETSDPYYDTSPGAVFSRLVLR